MTRRLRDSARGQECTLRFHPPCDAETVVACHVKPPAHGRVGGKVSDLWTVHACHRCHDILDLRDFRGFEAAQDFYWQRVFAALVETQQRMLDVGLVQFGGAP